MIAIRPLAPHDLDRSVELWRQLGYRASVADYRERLRKIAEDGTHLLLAAADEKDEAVGLIHAQATPLMADEPLVTIWSLVVAEDMRNRNIGALLLAAAEEWTRTLGYPKIGLASRTSRTRAHRFYLRHGYEIEKQSYWLMKSDLSAE